jgi:hypothetical protein
MVFEFHVGSHEIQTRQKERIQHQDHSQNECKPYKQQSINDNNKENHIYMPNNEFKNLML